MDDIKIVVAIVVPLLGIFFAALKFLMWLTQKFSIIEFQIEKIPNIEKNVNNTQDLCTRIELLEEKVSQQDEKLWKFLMDRAMSEALTKNLGKRNSPFVINNAVRKFYDSFLDELKDFYYKIGRHLSEIELFKEIGLNFSDKLIEKVCIPLGLNTGSCVIVAMELAKEPKGIVPEVKEIQLEQKGE